MFTQFIIRYEFHGQLLLLNTFILSFIVGHFYQTAVRTISILFLLLTLVMYVVGDDVFPCPTPLCKCDNEEKEAICSGEKLTCIPRLPETIERVTFTNGNFRILSDPKNY